MRKAKRCIILLLCGALINLSLLTGCASTGPPVGSKGEGMSNPQREMTEKEEYIQRLKSKPPQELTAEEIAYLELVAEQKQARSQSTIAAFTVAGVGVGVLASIILIAFASGSDTDTPSE